MVFTEGGEKITEVGGCFAAINITGRVVVSGPDGQADLALVWVEADDFDFDFLSFLQDIAWVLDVLVSDFGDVHESFDALLKFDKGAEVSQLFDVAGPDGAGSVALGDTLAPWVRRELFDAQREALVLFVDVGHNSFDFLAEIEELGGVLDPVCPGDVGDVHEAVDAFFDADEDTEFGDVAHFAVDGTDKGEPGG